MVILVLTLFVKSANAIAGVTAAQIGSAIA